MRPVTPRPLGEHLQTLARIISQLDADDSLGPERRANIIKALGEAMTEIQAELQGK